MSSPLIPGYATPEGTARFSQKFSASGSVAENHFRAPLFDLTLSSIGMGTYLGDADNPTDEQVSAAAITSVESGAINVLDTAINYRYQKAERSLKTAIEQLLQKGFSRDEIFVSSKNGYISPDADSTEDFRSYFQKHFFESGLITPDDIAGGAHCMAPAYLSDQLEKSRQNLGLETIDLMYLHNAAESQLGEVGPKIFMERLKKTFEFYEKARTENKIRFYGMATWTCFRVPVQETQEYLSLESVVRLAEEVGGADHGFRFIQLPFNFALTEAAVLQNQPVQQELTTLLQAAFSLNIGVFTSVPLMQGQLLSQPLPEFPGLTTRAQACLQMIRSHPGILAPMVGHKRPEHVRENLAVAKVSPMDMEHLNALLAATV